MSDEVDVLVEFLRWARMLWEFNRQRHVPTPDDSHPASSEQGSEEAAATDRILLLGPGGVGKSTLGRLLSADYKLLVQDPGRYEESIDVETFRLVTGDAVEVVVLPGQEHRRAVTWNGILDEVGGGRIRGIIYVTSYGYHSLGAISYKSHRLFHASGGKKGPFLQAFLDDCRREELQILKELMPYLLKSPLPLWLLSLVTKQDLWWGKRKDVERWYQHGPYSELIRQFAAQPTIRHELVFGSLAIRNLTTGQNELLVKTTAGYDQVEQIASVKRLVDATEALSNWEKQT